MKNKQQGYIGITIVSLIALALLGGGVYIYSTQTPEVDTQVNEQENSTSSISSIIQNQNQTQSQTQTPKPTGLTDAQFLAAYDNDESKAEVVARGDINNDGYEDAIIQSMSCGASCSFHLTTMLNIENKTAKKVVPTSLAHSSFAPAYYGSSAAKSSLKSITIKNGIITLVGNGLMCMMLNSEEPCEHEKWSILRTVTYKFDGKDIVQQSVTPPVPPPAQITKGKYRFTEYTYATSGTLQTLEYVMTIESEAVLGPISLTIDGVQTTTRIKANGMGSKDTIDVVFDSYTSGNTGILYKKGDVLFTINRAYGGPTIEWKKMQPVAEYNKVSAWFKKMR